MNFNLRRPCRGCPFRIGAGAVRFLGKQRARQISEALVVHQQTFSCHETVPATAKTPRLKKDEEHCAGALILLEKLEMPNQMMRWMERIGYYDHTKLDMDADVFDTFDDFVVAQSEAVRR